MREIKLKLSHEMRAWKQAKKKAREGVPIEFKVKPLKVIWGIPGIIKPIRNAPEGRQRIRLRNNKCAELFVKTPEGIRRFVLENKEDCWWVNPKLEQGRNIRP